MRKAAEAATGGPAAIDPPAVDREAAAPGSKAPAAGPGAEIRATHPETEER